MANPGDEIEMSSSVRRLPIYLLLDCSYSMFGAPIEAVKRGVEQFKHEVDKDTAAAESIHVGIITFGGGGAEFVTRGLAPMEQFSPPSLDASGNTPLGQAMWLLNESLDKDVKKGVKGKERGDYKPLVFILTDGAPDPGWEQAHEEIKRRQENKVLSVITVGCGPNIQEATLKAISVGEKSTFNMDNDAASFAAFFKWVTQSAIAGSKPKESDVSDQAVSKPPPDSLQPVF